MALQESGWFERASIEIRASDASSDAIERARKGVYRERSFRSLSPERRAEYFRVDGERTWRVRPDLQSRIQYSVANLVNTSDIADLCGADVIFCRNVFIYFSDAAIARTVASFARYIQVPGYLFVGSSESLIRATTEFVLEDVDDAVRLREGALMESVLRVLVVDDSAYVRKVVKEMLSRSPFIEVVRCRTRRA
jgi:chemotaxis protein methyltransferase CheR